ncbi:MAG: PorT family protein [Saprospiraceae bacterium]|nr:PorT family protein [Candidatus Vicinibacter affinis]
MKKKILSMLTFALFVQSLFAQFQMGVEVGPSVSNMTIKGTGSLINDPDPFLGIRAGLSASFSPMDAFSIKSGLYYHKTGFIASQSLDFEIFDVDIPANLKAITQLHFIELPVLAQYNFGKGVIKGYLEAGPQMSLAVDGDIRTRASLLVDFNLGTYDINMRNSNFRQFEWGGVIGAGIKWKLNESMRMSLGTQYLHGFTDLTNEPILDIRTSRNALSAQLGLQYQF